MHSPVEQPKLRVLGGIDPPIALFGRSFSLGFDPMVVLAKNGAGNIYPIHNRLHTENKTQLIQRAGRLVCVNAAATLDVSAEVLKIAADMQVPAYVSATHPDFDQYEPTVFDGTSADGFARLMQHIRDPERYPAETLTAHLQPHEQQGEQL
ncbi:MAG: hypothetical protein WBP26_03010 [Candidatus Saccharimonadales bacterium]